MVHFEREFLDRLDCLLEYGLKKHGAHVEGYSGGAGLKSSGGHEVELPAVEEDEFGVEGEHVVVLLALGRGFQVTVVELHLILANFWVFVRHVLVEVRGGGVASFHVPPELEYVVQEADHAVVEEFEVSNVSPVLWNFLNVTVYVIDGFSPGHVVPEHILRGLVLSRD